MVREDELQRPSAKLSTSGALTSIAANLNIELTAQPAESAGLRAVLASTSRALGLARQAIPMEQSVLDYYRGAVSREDPATLGAMDNPAQS